MKVLFLTYTNRSGSTYLANLLSSSENICVCPEGDKLVSLFLEDPSKKFVLTENLLEKISKTFITDSKLVNWLLKPEVFTHIEKAETNLEAFLSVLEYYKNSNKPDAGFVMFKAERISALMNKIARSGKASGIWGKIFFLSLLRDPRAVYASQKATQFPDLGVPMATDPVIATWTWKMNTGKVLNCRADEKSHIILKYEFLLMNPEQALQRISKFISQDLSTCSPAKGDLASRLTEKEKKIHRRIGESPDKNRINAWETILSQKEIYLVESTGRQQMRSLGYKRSGAKFRFIPELLRIYSILGISLNRIYQKTIFWLRGKKFHDNY